MGTVENIQLLQLDRKFHSLLRMHSYPASLETGALEQL